MTTRTHNYYFIYYVSSKLGESFFSFALVDYTRRLVAVMNLAILCRSHLGSVLYTYSGRPVAAMNLAILCRSPLVPYSIYTVGDW